MAVIPPESIQDAINNLPATGSVVEMGPGTFLLDTALTIPSGCTLTGQGQTTILKPQTGIGTAIVGASGSVKAGLGEVNVTLKDFVVDSTDGLASGIAFYGATNLTVENIEVRDVASPTEIGGYGFYFEECDDLTLDRLRAVNIAMRDGVQVKGCHRVRATRIFADNCTIYGIDAHNSTTIAPPRDNEDITIDGLHVINSGRILDIADGPHWSVRDIRGDNNGWGIDIRGAVTDCEISNPQITNTTVDAAISTFYATEINDLRIKGGYIKTVGNGKPGMWMGPNSAPGILNGLFIDGIIVDGAAGNGIYVVNRGAGVTDVRITGVRTINNGDRGIRLNGVDTAVVMASQSKFNNVGITVDGTVDVSVVNNDFQDNVTAAGNELNSPVGSYYINNRGWN